MSVLVGGKASTVIYANAAALTAFNYTTSTLNVGTNNFNGMLAQVIDLGAFYLNTTDTSVVDNISVIAATPAGNWLAMQLPFSIPMDTGNVIDPRAIPTLSGLKNGTAALPSVAFLNDMTTGIYLSSSSSHILGFAANATSIGTWSTSAFTLASGVQLVTPIGLVTAPAICVGPLANANGLYGISTTTVGVAIAGAAVALVTASALNLQTGVVLEVAGTQVVGPRRTGWTIMTGTASRTTYATSSVTTAQLAEVVFALQQDLGQSAGGHGLIDA